MLAAGLLFQTGPQAGTAATGSQLIREGRLAEALELYSRAVEASSKSMAAHYGAGVTLDLLGRYEEARRHFAQAIKAAPTPAEKIQATRALAVSFAFTADCRGAEKADRGAYDTLLATADFYGAGEVADEIGRICLEAGDADAAYNWYRRGHDAGLQEPGLQEENRAASRRDLWDFRWAHARARIAARRGKRDEARRLVEAARAILDKGANPEQRAYFPYLAGYVAYYAGDYRAALAELEKGEAGDPAIESLMAQCYQKLGDPAKALEWSRKAAGATAHSVPVAFARAFASAKAESIH